MKIKAHISVDLVIQGMSTPEINELNELLTIELQQRATRAHEKNKHVLLSSIWTKDFANGTAFSWGLKILCWPFRDKDSTMDKSDTYNHKILSAFEPTMAQIAQVSELEFLKIRNLGKMKWAQVEKVLIAHGYKPLLF
ncbi:MAG: hypothetical protein V4651_08580 [Bacteroidota bacterium]